jgi:hypothetical protein
MMSVVPKVRDAAFAAFEKIDPVVCKHVVSILVDDNRNRKRVAIDELGKIGAEAKAAVPALKGFLSFVGIKPERPEGDYGIELSTLDALVSIAPDDLSVHTIVLSLVAGADQRDRGTGKTYRERAIAM